MREVSFSPYQRGEVLVWNTDTLTWELEDAVKELDLVLSDLTIDLDTGQILNWIDFKNLIEKAIKAK